MITNLDQNIHKVDLLLTVKAKIFNMILLRKIKKRKHSKYQRRLKKSGV